MGIKCIIDNISYTEKPNKEEIRKIINRMTIDKVKEYEIDEIKEYILKGHTIRPSVCGAKENTWQSQQMFFIDIDNSDNYISYQEMIELLENLNLKPAFIYTSFNHKKYHHKYRIVFVFDEAIEDFDTAKAIQLYLMDMIGNSFVDKSCKNLNRIYFGGKEIVYQSDNKLKLSDLKEKISKFQSKKSPQTLENTAFEGNEVKSTYNNKYITLLYVPFTQNHKTLAITAIEGHNADYFLQKYNPEKKIFKTKQEFLNYIIKEVNLPELLEIENYKSFNCIFHDDKNPSAGIFRNENDDWIYNCFACNVSYNIIGVIERLGNFKTRVDTYDFIKKMLNIEITETEFQQKQKAILLETLQALYSEEFLKYCPQTNKNIRTIREYLQQLILIAMDNIYDEEFTDSEGNVVFFTSVRELAKRLGISQYNIDKISQRLVVLVYHELLKKLDDTEIPKRFLKTAKKIMNDRNFENKVNFFAIPSLTVNKYPEIEAQAIKWRNNHYTIKGTSYEMFYRAEGKEVADKLYPQFKTVVDKETGEIKDRTTTKASDERTKDIIKTINKLIDKKGYATEKEIIKALSKKYGKSTIETQIKRSLPQIIEENNLKRVQTNKELKEKLKIKSKGYPVVIIKDTL